MEVRKQMQHIRRVMLALVVAGSVAFATTHAEPVRADSWDITVDLSGVVPAGLAVDPIVPAPSSDRLLYEWLAAYQAWQASGSPAPSGGGGDVDAAIHAAFDPIGRGGEAFAVAKCESGFNPGAISPNGYYHGLFQLGAHFQGTVNMVASVLGRPADRLDPWVNAAAAAHTVEQDGGWSQWACKP